MSPGYLRARTMSCCAMTIAPCTTGGDNSIGTAFGWRGVIRASSLNIIIYNKENQIILNKMLTSVT